VSKKRAYVPFEPEYFEPGALVVLHPEVFDHLDPGALGLIVDRSPERVEDSVFGSQYLHSVIVEGEMYGVARSGIVREVLSEPR